MIIVCLLPYKKLVNFTKKIIDIFPLKPSYYNFSSFKNHFQFDWVCEEAGKVPLAQALFFAGSIVGGILLGYLADRFGRIPALILCNLIGAVAGIITTYSYTFELFAFSRFLMGMAFDNCFVFMYILGMVNYILFQLKDQPKT